MISLSSCAYHAGGGDYEYTHRTHSANTTIIVHTVREGNIAFEMTPEGSINVSTTAIKNGPNNIKNFFSFLKDVILVLL